MNKIFQMIGFLLLPALLGLSPVTEKKDVIDQARKIKAAAQEINTDSKYFEPSVLTYPEELVYNAKFWGIKIGQFVIMNNGKTVLNGRQAYHLELTVNTLPFFGSIFKAKDRYVSFMDAQTFAVLRHEEYIKGGTFLESAVDFDYQNNTATYHNFVDSTESTVEIPDQIYDILCGGYYLRLNPMGIGDMVDIKIYADAKIYDYTGLISSRTEVNLPYQEMQEAFFFKPYLFHEEKQINKLSAEVYFSITTPKKPLRADLKSRFGSVHVILGIKVKKC